MCKDFGEFFWNIRFHLHKTDNGSCARVMTVGGWALQSLHETVCIRRRASMPNLHLAA